jgi:glycosyltransferase involved in cell wall biosynthesis
MIVEISGMEGFFNRHDRLLCTALAERVMAVSTIEPYRVLFVLPRWVAGGLERVTLNLIQGLRERGVDCCLVVGAGDQTMLAQARQATTVHVAGGGAWRLLRGVTKIVGDYQPTHVITAFADVSLIAWLATKLTRRRAALIIGIHGTQGAVAASQGWRGRAKFVLDRGVARWLYPRAARVIAVSQGVAEDLRRHYRIAPMRLRAIYSPMLTVADWRQLETPPPPTCGATRTLVAVGRLAPEKGFDILLRAMPAVCARFEVQLKIYGEGAERARLTALIDTLGLQTNVRLMGQTTEPLRVMSQAELLVFPSRHEGFGVALIEALACARQIVASDCTHGPAEVLAQGRYGQLVPPENVDALAEAIIAALEGRIHFAPELLRQRAQEFSAHAAYAHYLDVLRETALSS